MSKHTTTKSMRMTDLIFFIMFGSFIGGALITFDTNQSLAVSFSIFSSFFGVAAIMMSMSLLHRLNIETQCAIAGVSFMDYCTCKFHRNLKKEQAKDQTTL